MACAPQQADGGAPTGAEQDGAPAATKAPNATEDDQRDRVDSCSAFWKSVPSLSSIAFSNVDAAGLLEG